VTRLELPGHDVVGIRAANPGPFSLTGTNTWIVGRDPAWLIDPGPALFDHLQSLEIELRRRGGARGIVLTHDHADHAEAVPELRRRLPAVVVAAARGEADVILSDGDRFGPLEVLATPGHAPDHLAFVLATGAGGAVVFTGDAVLGEGSVFIMPGHDSLARYLEALARLRERPLAVIAPGHGPVVEEPHAKLTEYIEHRLDRERRLTAALEEGRRSVDELLDAAWSDAPTLLRPAAAVTLAAHLEKLQSEGRLPPGVEWPAGWPEGWG
jgi:glyoxylase-like metal-dependent hydrolase (beta-lactamase superfamily II)